MPSIDLRQVRAIVTDANVLGRLDPAAVAAYLARTGWTQTDKRGPGGVWTRELDGGRAAAVLLPNDQTRADFPLRVGLLLTTLARTEDRSQLAVLVDLYTVTAAPPGAGRIDLEALLGDVAKETFEAEWYSRDLDDIACPGHGVEPTRDAVRDAFFAGLQVGWHEVRERASAALERASDPQSGADLIAAERRRQIVTEGDDEAHDDRHDRGELIEAARCYAYAAQVAEWSDLGDWFGLDAEGRIKLPAANNARWPWSSRDWKPTGDPVRDLTKAAALLAAEIDRLLRKASREARP